MNTRAPWFEVWADDTLEPPYLLLVAPDPNVQGGFTVRDPREGYKVVHQDTDYNSIKLWLLEDEYTLVDGRMHDQCM